MTLTVYPIRHHGPGSARSLERALEANPPELLLIEGPADGDALLPFLSSREMRPPVALMAHVVGSPEQAVFYPMAAFSPEFVALRWALARGVPARFMDLPAAVTLAQGEAVQAETEARQDAPSEPEAALRHDPLSVLAQAAGYTDFERWWEGLVEVRGDDAEVFGAVSEVMEAVREDGETAGRDVLREAQMRQCLREGLKTGQKVAVVCGAWHAPALKEAVLERENKADPARLKGLPRVKTALTWVPWTHGRLTMASGYGAGIQSPGWYAHLFAGRPNVSAEWLTRSARLLREHKLDASSAQVIDAVRLGEALAAIRGLGLPGLPELNDATQAVFGWASAGNTGGLPLRLLHERLIVGETLGSVPEGVPSVPLSLDLAATQKRLRLKPEATSRELTLDLREETDLARSQLLHRLTLLNISWGAPADVRGTGTFKEGWTLRWGAATRWYASHPVLDGLPTASLDRVIGRDPDIWLSEDPDGHPLARRLRRLQAEVQMLLYQHPLNDVRSEQGLATVNSFWVSGCGRPPRTLTLPAATRVLDELRAPLLGDDMPLWLEAWRHLDATALVELTQALDAGHPVRLTLCGERHAVTLASTGTPSLGRRLLDGIKQLTARSPRSTPSSFLASL